ncbi:MAG: hypothetical protein NUW37_18345 [Planctomycetes bacterium]|nr:hypothetical protein [Planctomycetota bacterium]
MGKKSSKDLLGTLALRRGFITKDQLSSCLTALADAPGDERTLGEVLLATGAIDKKKLAILRRMEEAVKARDEDLRLIPMIVENGLASKERLDQYLVRQKQIFKESGDIVRLTELLREDNLIGERERRQLLSRQRLIRRGMSARQSFLIDAEDIAVDEPEKYREKNMFGDEDDGIEVEDVISHKKGAPPKFNPYDDLDASVPAIVVEDYEDEDEEARTPSKDLPTYQKDVKNDSKQFDEDSEGARNISEAAKSVKFDEDDELDDDSVYEATVTDDDEHDDDDDENSDSAELTPQEVAKSKILGVRPGEDDEDEFDEDIDDELLTTQVYLDQNFPRPEWLNPLSEFIMIAAKDYKFSLLLVPFEFVLLGYWFFVAYLGLGAGGAAIGFALTAASGFVFGSGISRWLLRDAWTIGGVVGAFSFISPAIVLFVASTRNAPSSGRCALTLLVFAFFVLAQVVGFSLAGLWSTRDKQPEIAAVASVVALPLVSLTLFLLNIA